MSYRSFKRVLGETSLERKCRFLFGACLLMLISGSFWWYSSRTEDLVVESSRRAGRGFVDFALVQKHWEKLESDNFPEWKAAREPLGKSLGDQEKYQATFIRTKPAAKANASDPSDKAGLKKIQTQLALAPDKRDEIHDER